MKKYPHIFLAAGGAVHLLCIVYNTAISLSSQLSGTLSTLILVLTVPTLLYNLAGAAVAALTFKKYVQRKPNPLAILSAIYYALPIPAFLLNIALSAGSMSLIGLIVNLVQLCACCCALVGALIINRSSKKFVSENNNEENAVDP